MIIINKLIKRNYLASTPPRPYPQRIFADFTIFGKHNDEGLLSIKPLAPTFKLWKPGLDSGVRMKSEGLLLFQFTPPVFGNDKNLGLGDDLYNNEIYDYSRRQYFGMRVSELGELLIQNKEIIKKDKKDKKDILWEFNRNPKKNPLFFEHPQDPRKRFRIKIDETNNDFFIFEIIRWPVEWDREPLEKVNVKISVNRGEFETLKQLIKYSIPRCIGFDQIFESASAPLWDVSGFAYEGVPQNKAGFTAVRTTGMDALNADGNNILLI